MEIYVGNIPKGTRPAELRKLLKESIRGSIFQKTFNKALSLGRLDDDIGVSIMRRKADREDYRYGHIVISSHRLSGLVLDALQGVTLRGSDVTARQFTTRNQLNDRRSDKNNNHWKNNTRRVEDRRQT